MSKSDREIVEEAVRGRLQFKVDADSRTVTFEKFEDIVVATTFHANRLIVMLDKSDSDACEIAALEKRVKELEKQLGNSKACTCGKCSGEEPMPCGCYPDDYCSCESGENVVEIGAWSTRDKEELPDIVLNDDITLLVTTDAEGQYKTIRLNDHEFRVPYCVFMGQSKEDIAFALNQIVRPKGYYITHRYRVPDKSIDYARTETYYEVGKVPVYDEDDDEPSCSNCKFQGKKICPQYAVGPSQQYLHCGRRQRRHTCLVVRSLTNG